MHNDSSKLVFPLTEQGKEGKSKKRTTGKDYPVTIPFFLRCAQILEKHGRGEEKKVREFFERVLSFFLSLFPLFSFSFL